MSCDSQATFFSPTQTGEEIRKTNRSYRVVAPLPPTTCWLLEQQTEGEYVWLCQVICVFSYHWTMRRKMFWVITDPQWSFDAVLPYGPVPGLFLGCFSISFFWLLAQHFAYYCTFSSWGSCSILPPSPGGYLGPMQETSKLQSQREAVKICSSCVCKHCSTWWCVAVLALLIWALLFIFCKATCFLCPDP